MGNPSALRAAGVAAILAVLPAAASAHGVAGNRFFPATLTIDDPAVADEMSLPTVAYSEGDAAETSISGEYSKRLTPTFGLSAETGWVREKASGASAASGFENIETKAKWQVLTSPEHEAIVSVGLSAEWGGTGASGIGAERHDTFTPTLWFGKGAGEAPEALAWARPLALTGSLGYAVPARRRDPGEAEDNPRVIVWGLALEYSLPYLQAHVRDVGLPSLLARLTPIIEASLQTPVTGVDRTTTGTINPGLIWAGRRFQLVAEAMVPINAASGRHVGAVIQLHMYLDDLLAHSLGKPIW